MDNFVFHKPSSIDDAIEAVDGKDEPKFLAGGQSLIPVMKLDMAQPSDLVSLAGVAELREIKDDGDKLIIGAMATHASVADSDTVAKAIPTIAEMAGHIGDAQVRNRGTMGGSVAHADPAADYPAALVALKAIVRTHKREIAAEDFFTELFETALEEGELITAIHFTKPKRSWYEKFQSPASKYAIAGVCVAEYDDGVRVAVTGAGNKVFRHGAMEKALSANFDPSALGGIDVDASDLRTDVEASAEYRAHLVEVMAKRAVKNAK